MNYNGWVLLPIVILGALLSMLALAVALRRERCPMICAVAALLCIVAAQLVLDLYYPANVAAENWTRMLSNWEELRSHWVFARCRLDLPSLNDDAGDLRSLSIQPTW